MKKIFTTILLSVFTLAIIAQTDIIPPQPHTPSDGDDEQMADVELDWYATTGAGVITYTLEVDLDMNFTAPVVFVTETSSAKMDKLNFNDIYYWRVKAADESGDVSEWSETFSFLVINRFKLNKPNDGDIDLPPNKSITWKKSYGGAPLSGISYIDCQIDTAYFWSNTKQKIAEEHMYDVSTVDTMAWAVGVGSTILYFDGTQWIEQAGNDLYSTYLVDGDNGWSVGKFGLILFYDGDDWIKQESPTSAHLHEVYFIDENNGWAVGEGGIILHYNGTIWEEQASNTTVDLLATYFIDNNNGWSVGKNGLILFYNGTVWSEQASNVDNDLFGVHFIDQSNGWAVGSFGTILYFNGSSWEEQMSNTAYDLYSVYMVNANTGWAVGKVGTIVNYVNGAWSEVNNSFDFDLYDVSFSDTIHGWAAGDQGTLIQYKLSGWSDETDDDFLYDLFGVFMVSNNEGWAVGDGGTIREYDGDDEWEPLEDTPSTLPLLGIAVADANNVWAIGYDGLVLYYNGTEWMEQESSTSDDLFDISFVDAMNGWAVGDGGTIIYYNGTEWDEQSSSTTKDLWGVSFVDATNGWAVGKSGTIVYYDGAAWDEQDNPSSKDLYSVSFADASIGWAAGKSGAIVHYNGTVWTEQESSTDEDLTLVTAISATQAWSGGGDDAKESILVQYDGNEWLTVASGTIEKQLLGASSFDNDFGFIVGQYGTILYKNGSGYSTPNNIKTTHADSSALFLSELYFGKDYYYTIRGRHSDDTSGWSISRYFTTIAKPINIAPKNGATDQMLDVIVSWEEVAGTYEYIIELCTDSIFSYSCIGHSDSNSFRPPDVVFGETYYWHVKARHSLDTTQWSETWSFTVLDKVTHVSPTNGSWVSELFPVLEWEEATGVNGYYIAYADNPNFDGAEPKKIVGSDIYTYTVPEQLIDQETYYWQVRAYIAGDTTQWSDPWSFTMGTSGVNKLLTENNINIYPNPTQGLVYVKFNADKQTSMKIKVTNLLGEALIVEDYTAHQGINTHSINMEKFGVGVYLIQMQSGHEVFTQRVLINK